MNNLEKERPAGWRASTLFFHIEESWSNTIASFHSMPAIASKLDHIDRLFAEFGGKGLNNPPDFFAAVMFIKCQSAFRIGAGLAFATPTESYCVMRSALEYAGYAVLCHATPGLAETWFRRDDTPASLAKVRSSFSHGKVRAAIAASDRKMAERYDLLYNEAVSWGAHPNEKALTSGAEMERGDAERRVIVVTLPAGGNSIKLATRRCAQIGVSALEMFELVFPERFGLLGISEGLLEARHGL